MKPISAVPMIALTRSQDNVEAINKALRNAGHPVHVTWLPDARDLGDALTQASAEMLMLFADEGIVDLASAMDFRARFAPDVPVLLVREKVDEAVIAEALGLGAQDVERIFPELVHRDSQGYLSVAYTDLAAVLVRAVQEQQALQETLRAEVAALRAELAALRAATAAGGSK